ncbi:hypothetical protein DDB_G0284707 [Dictyostelium discoideum AX4]|uniref:Terpene synthase 6 n=1 Tax=Dictyostelium discoideum TaxID=44689 RepID=TPS6_DICDI|nr:hypothetical protein DDB_G0284707 [Dictyostelium discoideum AX4]Q54P86.1 RecName: Full=Terpene synthase 6 [Dictyostelium discoideum]APC23390.1 terpene synthase [Dictyostelium discoideum]EAL65123.1 hypothetical protein DDB_G0284707 [Dictyostelium discoideum AX4]|eukprot:XP_638489.1 hypothetical protein DDB_G0284707 [Dictyostelium discoideum AX4]
MSLSLGDIKFPDNWDLIPNEKNYIDYVYKESIELEVWRPNNKRDLMAHNNVVSLAKYFWPHVDFNRLVMGGELMVWFFSFDDVLDAGIYTDEKQMDLVKRMDNVFINGTVESDATGPEKMALHLRKKCEVMCGKRRKDTFNRFISSCVQWVDSIIPFNKLRSAQGTSPHLELYSYLRKVNIGAYPCVTLTEVMLDHEIEYYIWSDPKWIKMNEDIAIITTLINDLVSYEKEVNDQAGDLNPLYFLQNQKNIPLPDSYKQVVDLIDFWVKDYQTMEQSLLNEMEFKDSKQRSDMEFILEHLRYLASGSKKWSMQTPRYCSPTSPFIEMRTKPSTPVMNSTKKQKIDHVPSQSFISTPIDLNN